MTQRQDGPFTNRQYDPNKFAIAWTPPSQWCKRVFAGPPISDDDAGETLRADVPGEGANGRVLGSVISNVALQGAGRTVSHVMTSDLEAGGHVPGVRIRGGRRRRGCPGQVQVGGQTHFRPRQRDILAETSEDAAAPAAAGATATSRRARCVWRARQVGICFTLQPVLFEFSRAPIPDWSWRYISMNRVVEINPRRVTDLGNCGWFFVIGKI